MESLWTVVKESSAATLAGCGGQNRVEFRKDLHLISFILVDTDMPGAVPKSILPHQLGTSPQKTVLGLFWSGAYDNSICFVAVS